ncbi:MAG: hypothetical protein IJ463_03500 [Bacilli bacterium]|nr:hypothetical protein [Bacilli bacterium]
MKKIFKLVVCFIIMFLLVGCTGTEVKDYYGLKDNYVSKVTFIVMDNQNNQLFYKKADTVFEKLTDVMKTSGIEFNYNNEYITSMFELESNNSYKWVYYIDEEGPYTSVSDKTIEKGKTYKFIYSSIQ